MVFYEKVFGVVVDLIPLKKSRGSDFVLKLYITNKDLLKRNKLETITIFKEKEKWFPNIAIGDIVRCNQFKRCEKFQTLLSTHATSIVVFHSQKQKDSIKAMTKNVKLPIPDYDIEQVLLLQDFLLTKKDFLSYKPIFPEFNKYMCKIENIKTRTYFDLLGLVIKIETGQENKWTKVFVVDGTINTPQCSISNDFFQETQQYGDYKNNNSYEEDIWKDINTQEKRLFDKYPNNAICIIYLFENAKKNINVLKINCFFCIKKIINIKTNKDFCVGLCLNDLNQDFIFKLQNKTELKIKENIDNYFKNITNIDIKQQNNSRNIKKTRTKSLLKEKKNKSWYKIKVKIEEFITPLVDFCYSRCKKCFECFDYNGESLGLFENIEKKDSYEKDINLLECPRCNKKSITYIYKVGMIVSDRKDDKFIVILHGLEAKRFFSKITPTNFSKNADSFKKLYFLTEALLSWKWIETNKYITMNVFPYNVGCNMKPKIRFQVFDTFLK